MTNRQRKVSRPDPEELRKPLADVPISRFLAKALEANRKAQVDLHKPIRAYPGTSNMNYTEAETEYLKKIDEYKRRVGKPFLTNTEIYAIMTKELGYRKV